ncbi:hypothetical protein AAC387_Pa07g2407 [Persea americana]
MEMLSFRRVARQSTLIGPNSYFSCSDRASKKDNLTFLFILIRSSSDTFAGTRDRWSIMSKRKPSFLWSGYFFIVLRLTDSLCQALGAILGKVFSRAGMEYLFSWGVFQFCSLYVGDMAMRICDTLGLWHLLVHSCRMVGDSSEVR